MTTVTLEGGRLLVDGAPTLLLAGELHNSSGSTGRFMADRWARIVDVGCNTVLAAVAWEQFEPEEGRFDPTCVDELLTGAREHGLRLVLLWFGSWKNGVSSYVPSWVRADPERFPVQHDAKRFDVEHVASGATPVLSPFAEANVAADARAFASFMGHLRDHDAERTVLMVQIENEIGTLGDSRDRSAAAEAAWASPVPDALLAHIDEAADGCRQKLLVHRGPDSSTWVDAFGEGARTDELFMAWHYASYVERVAEAGRAQHDLPLFVNAWLDAGGEQGPVSGGDAPGNYPSGGPLPHVAAAWHAAAPTIDFLAPDIYAEGPEHWLGHFGEVTSTLFVPELHRSRAGLGTIFTAIGSFGAIGTSPFGVDELQDDEHRRLRRAYRQLGAIARDILDAQQSGSIRGFVVRQDHPVELDLGPYHFSVATDLRFDGAPSPDGYGLLLATGEHDFIAAGCGFLLNATTAEGRAALLHTVQELDLSPATGRARDLPVLRWLNGDETLSGHMVRVSDEQVCPWPGGLPASPSVTGVVRFSLLAP